MIARPLVMVGGAISLVALILGSPGHAAGSVVYGAKIGDTIRVVGTHVLCAIAGDGRHHRIPQIGCFLWKQPVTLDRAIAYSYAFHFSTAGVVVSFAGTAPQIVFTVRSDPAVPSGGEAPPDPLKGPREIRLRSGDAVRVASSNLECVVSRLSGRTRSGLRNLLAITCSQNSLTIVRGLLPAHPKFRLLTSTISEDRLEVRRGEDLGAALSGSGRGQILFARAQPQA
jgi:hypothetical protein